MKSLASILISQDQTVRDAIDYLNRNERGAVVVVDQRRRLVDVIADGDIRRAMLKKVPLETPLKSLQMRRRGTSYPHPIYARMGATQQDLFKLMMKEKISQVPIVNSKMQVVDMTTLRDMAPSTSPEMQAVVMAGGYGKRLRPLTQKTPKPMLTIGRKPLLERTLEQLRDAGITNVCVTTHYKGNQITDYFGKGGKWGLNLQYIHEKKPLGTAGSLRYVSGSDQPILILNGDILTQINFRAFLGFHREQKADMTVAVRSYELRMPFGVLNCRGPRVTGISEKPTIQHFINAGIYLINPVMCRYIPPHKPFDMPSLIELLIRHQHRVIGFPILEYWIDIGNLQDYRRAEYDSRRETSIK